MIQAVIASPERSEGRSNLIKPAKWLIEEIACPCHQARALPLEKRQRFTMTWKVNGVAL